MKNALQFTWVVISLFLTAVDLAIFGWYITWPGNDKIVEILIHLFGGCVFILTLYSISQAVGYFRKDK
jgi:hypothetical protein